MSAVPSESIVTSALAPSAPPLPQVPQQAPAAVPDMLDHDDDEAALQAALALSLSATLPVSPVAAAAGPDVGNGSGSSSSSNLAHSHPLSSGDDGDGGADDLDDIAALHTLPVAGWVDRVLRDNSEYLSQVQNRSSAHLAHTLLYSTLVTAAAAALPPEDPDGALNTGGAFVGV